jgi:hypothetical protein
MFRPDGVWLAAVLSTCCLIGSDEVLASPMAGEYQVDAGSELRICSHTTWCAEPVSIAGVRFWFDPDDHWPLYRELFDSTYDLYYGNLVSAGVYRILEVINSPDIGPYAESDGSYLTFTSDTSFLWTGIFSGFLPCYSFGLDPNSEDCWSDEPRDFELINFSATLVPEPSGAMQLSSGLLGMLLIRGALRKRSVRRQIDPGTWPIHLRKTKRQSARSPHDSGRFISW